MRLVGLIAAIVASNVIAYFIFLTFASDADPSLIIAFTFLSLLAIDFRDTVDLGDAGEIWLPRLALAASLTNRDLRVHALVFGLATLGYNFFFWYGFSQLTNEPGLVLSLMALNICLSPFVVSYIERFSLLPIKTIVAGVILLGSAAVTFTLDTSVDEFARLIWEAEYRQAVLQEKVYNNISVGAVVFVLLALCCEIAQDFELARLYDRARGYKTLRTEIPNFTARRRTLYNIAYAMQLPVSSVVVLGWFVYSGITSNWWGKSGFELIMYSVFTLVFVAFGVGVKNKLNSKIRADGLRPEVLAISLAMRPIVFYLTFPVVSLVVILSGCETQSCSTFFGAINVTNKFSDTYPSDSIATVLVLLAGIMLFSAIGRHGFFSGAIRFSHVLLPVNSISPTKDFYEKLGFGESVDNDVLPTNGQRLTLAYPGQPYSRVDLHQASDLAEPGDFDEQTQFVYWTHHRGSVAQIS